MLTKAVSKWFDSVCKQKWPKVVDPTIRTYAYEHDIKQNWKSETDLVCAYEKQVEAGETSNKPEEEKAIGH